MHDMKRGTRGLTGPGLSSTPTSTFDLDKMYANEEKTLDFAQEQNGKMPEGSEEPGVKMMVRKVKRSPVPSLSGQASRPWADPGG